MSERAKLDRDVHVPFNVHGTTTCIPEGTEVEVLVLWTNEDGTQVMAEVAIKEGFTFRVEIDALIEIDPPPPKAEE